MAERTITDILGWRIHVANEQMTGDVYAGPDGALHVDQPSVDDLLAWLLRDAETQDGVEFVAVWSTEDVGDELVPPRTYSVHISISDDDGNMHTRTSAGRTLLAALEVAVRAVDTASQPTGVET